MNILLYIFMENTSMLDKLDPWIYFISNVFKRYLYGMLQELHDRNKNFTGVWLRTCLSSPWTDLLWHGVLSVLWVWTLLVMTLSRVCWIWSWPDKMSILLTDCLHFDWLRPSSPRPSHYWSVSITCTETSNIISLQLWEKLHILQISVVICLLNIDPRMWPVNITKYIRPPGCAW